MPVDKEKRLAIIKAYNGMCQYCGSKGADHIDHIVAQSTGGGDEIENLTLACQSCNLKKSSLHIPDPFKGILIARALSKKSKIENIINNKNRKNKNLSPSRPKPWKIYGIKHYNFRERHEFWDYQRLKTLFERCKFASQNLDPKCDTLHALASGNISELFSITSNNTDVFIDIRDLLNDYEYQKREDFFHLRIAAHYWKPKPNYMVWTFGCNLITGMMGKNETTVMTIGIQYIVKLLSEYTPEILADAAVNGLYLPYIEHDRN